MGNLLHTRCPSQLELPAVTKHHGLGGLTEIYSPQLWRLKVQDQAASMVTL